MILRCPNGSAGALRQTLGLGALAQRGEGGALFQPRFPDAGIVEPFFHVTGESISATAEAAPQLK